MPLNANLSQSIDFYSDVVVEVPRPCSQPRINTFILKLVVNCFVNKNTHHLWQVAGNFTQLLLFRGITFGKIQKLK